MDKCYANSLGNCCSKISGEHIVSKSILDDIVQVSGFRKFKGESKAIGKNSLVTNVLCVHHNGSLSPYDDEIAAHKKHIELIDARYELFRRSPQYVKKNAFIYKVNGSKIERWFLKTLINLCKANQKEVIININELLPYLFGDKKFEYPYGLGMLTKPNLTVNSADVIEMSPILANMNGDDVLQGGVFRYRGFAYLLLLPPYPFVIEREKPIVDSIFSGIFSDLLGCQYNWHNEEIFYTSAKPSGLVVNAQVIQYRWDKD